MENILQQLDELYSQGLYEEGYQFLLEQMKKAMQENNDVIILGLLSELMGYYRVRGQFEMGNQMAQNAVAILHKMGIEESVSAATTYLNIATLKKVAHEYDQASFYFEKCQKIYAEQLTPNDVRYIALLNNMSIFYHELNQGQKAIELALTALQGIMQIPDGQIETAISYSNIAAMYFDMEEIDQAKYCIEEATKLFEQYGPSDPHYISVTALQAQYELKYQHFNKAIELFELAREKIVAIYGENRDFEIMTNNIQLVKEKMEFTPTIQACHKLYQEKLLPLIKKECPEALPFLAIGLLGFGSQCLGYDDEVSKDHDFSEDVCIWIPRVNYLQYGKKLETIYEKVAVHRNISHHGQGRVGVLIIEDFIAGFIGQMPETQNQFFTLQESNLKALTSGYIFEDNLGKMTEIIDQLRFYPRDVRLTKLANQVALMAQSGQYNYYRCLNRLDDLALFQIKATFIEATIQTIHLLNNVYCPFYKWSSRSLKALPKLNEVHQLLEKIMISNNQDVKILIENICNLVLVELKKQGLSQGDDDFLENHVQNILSKRGKI